jgi:predicted aldo/keto reductase-like oxidoreductase
VPIDSLFAVYNEYALAKITASEVSKKANSYEVKAMDCIECGKCENICPQNITIRDNLKKIAKFNR